MTPLWFLFQRWTSFTNSETSLQKVNYDLPSGIIMFSLGLPGSFPICLRWLGQCVCAVLMQRWISWSAWTCGMEDCQYMCGIISSDSRTLYLVTDTVLFWVLCYLGLKSCRASQFRALVQKFKCHFHWNSWCDRKEKNNAVKYGLFTSESDWNRNLVLTVLNV